MDESKMPILVGCGQVTQREPDPKAALSPMDLTAAAVRKAAEDSGAGQALLGALDTIVMLRSFSDTSWRFVCPFGKYTNPPRSLANRLDAHNAKRLVYTHPGGNMPQWSVNRMFEMIRRTGSGGDLWRRGVVDAKSRPAGQYRTRLERGSGRLERGLGRVDPGLERHGRPPPHGRRDLCLTDDRERHSRRPGADHRRA